MAINESFMANQMARGLYGDPCCTEVEWLFLQDTSERQANNIPIKTLTTQLEVNSKTHEITAFQKSTGIYRSWLITQSSNSELEGLVIRNPTKHPDDNLLRYLHANVVFLTETITNLRDPLEKCGLNIPSKAGDFINDLVYLLDKLGQPIGPYFESNTIEFSQWTHSHYPQVAATQWPTRLGYTTEAIQSSLIS